MLLCAGGLIAAHTGSYESRQAAPLAWFPGVILIFAGVVLAIGYSTIRGLVT